MADAGILVWLTTRAQGKSPLISQTGNDLLVAVKWMLVTFTPTRTLFLKGNGSIETKVNDSHSRLDIQSKQRIHLDVL